MALAQDNLIRNFPTFMATLQGDPAGLLPNFHIAVVSQDMGAGDGSIAGCGNDANGFPAGQQGILQHTARGTCSATNLLPGATFISNVAGVANYTGNVEDVFGCIAALGESGCGFTHQFAAVLRALGADGRVPPAENTGALPRTTAPSDRDRRRVEIEVTGGGTAGPLPSLFVGATGFEPATPCPPDRCANQAAPRPDVCDPPDTYQIHEPLLNLA